MEHLFKGIIIFFSFQNHIFSRNVILDNIQKYVWLNFNISKKLFKNQNDHKNKNES